MTVDDWARDWGIPLAVVNDLKQRLGMDGTYATQHVKRATEGASEGHVQTKVQLEAARLDIHLFRNNVGVAFNEDSRPVRYGLANESAEMNARLASSDLIGIRKVFIEPRHLGSTIGQFVARECKHGTWTYSGTEREIRQLAFGSLILQYGGDFAFAPGTGTL
jgi:hypothetical protein